jgi:lysozyme family protein
VNLGMILAAEWIQRWAASPPPHEDGSFGAARPAALFLAVGGWDRSADGVV